MRDYDEITAFLGEWGPAQKLIFLLLTVSVIPNGFAGFSIIFVGDIPEHRCSIPGNLNLSQAWMNRTIPLVPGTQIQYTQCSRYRLDVIRNLSELFPDPDLLNVSGIDEEPCLDGWDYSQDQYTSTIVSEWDLVCNDNWKEPFAASLYFLGVLIGSGSSGMISDRFGRKIVLFGTMGIQVLFNLLITLSPSWEIFCLINFFKGIGEISNYMTAFVLGSELLQKSIRVTYSTLGIGFFYAVGYMLLPFVAYFMRGWRMLILILSLISLLYIPLWWFIPESPRWLLSKGRVKEAESIIRFMAKKNGITPPAVLFTDDELEHIQNKQVKSVPVIQLIKTSRIRAITMINLVVWMILAIGYYGLSLNVPNLHGNDYLNCFLFGAIEIPANIAAWLLLRKFPRKLSLSGILALSGGVLLFMNLIPSSLLVLSTALVLIGKLGNTCAFSIAFVYTSELYPTPMRNTGIGVSSMASRAGSIISPYVAMLDAYKENLPFIVMGVLMVFSAIVVLFLPETFNIPLPDTISQMQKVKWCKCSHSDSTQTRENNVVIFKEEML
ncbi:solute carrier family 22 member 5-like isoform X2 [Amblyraja radiata]|uniref:solute carrier family 22 member 5-like isoform X2 n=1 Tax=Amblyraja radiata TaxID=386614 RepID=UPI0014025D7B|nr:solute carrier family 22 member 5-like isoform X2 [Amblyraja radiata]